MEFEEKEIGDGKEGLIVVGLLNRSIGDASKRIKDFINRKRGEFFEEEKDIRMFFGYNAKLEISTSVNLSLSYETEETKAIPKMAIVSHRITPESILFKNMERDVLAKTISLEYIDIKDGMLVISGEDRHIIKKKKIKIKKIDRNYLYKFIFENVGAIGVIYFTNPLSLKTFLTNWKMKTWNNNAKKNYLTLNTNNIRSYEYRQLTDEELEEVIRKGIEKAYKVLFINYMDGKDTSVIEEGVWVWEQIAKVYGVSDINRRTDLEMENIRYEGYLNLVEELRR